MGVQILFGIYREQLFFSMKENPSLNPDFKLGPLVKKFTVRPHYHLSYLAFFSQSMQQKKSFDKLKDSPAKYSLIKRKQKIWVLVKNFSHSSIDFFSLQHR